MPRFTPRTLQFAAAGIVAVLLVVLTLSGLHSRKAKYSTAVASESKAISESANIFALLKRFTGSNDSLNSLLEKLRTDSLNANYIFKLEQAGLRNNIEVFSAYAFYLKGIQQNNDSLLQLSADVFFESAMHDPDSLSDKTTYSVYSIRACDRILKRNPGDKDALTRKATCLVYYDNAVMQGVSLLKEVESLDSNYAQAQHHLMLLALQSGQYEKAKKRLKKLLLLQPGNQQYAEILRKLETQQ